MELMKALEEMVDKIDAEILTPIASILDSRTRTTGPRGASRRRPNRGPLRRTQFEDIEETINNMIHQLELFPESELRP